MSTFEPRELFVYTNGDTWELGMVKRENNTGTGYFCWYSTGDTAANTPIEKMHKLENAGLTKIEGELLRAERTCELNGTLSWEWQATSTAFYTHNLSCGHNVTSTEPKPPNYCEDCGAKVVS